MFRVHLPFSLACLLAMSCGDGEGEPPPGGGDAASAVVYANLVRGPDTLVTYLQAASAIPSGEIALSGALELPDGNYYATDDAIFFGNFETKTLQRYEVAPDYSIMLAGEFSMANYGVDFINQQPLFFSETSAYYFDTAQGQIITFNPKTMEITGELQVPEVLRDGYAPHLSHAERVGNRYIAAIAYSTEDYSKVAPDSTIAVAIEDNRAQPVRLIRDERGAMADQSFVDDAGNFYALADGVGGYFALTGLQELPSAKLLRVSRGANEVDPDYLFDLGEALDTPGVNGLWPVGGAKFVVQAWASDVDPSAVLASPDDFDTAPYFDWVQVDAATREARPIAGLARGPNSYSLLRFRVDGQTYLQQYAFSGGFETGRVELYALHDDATTEKVAETGRGDFRLLARVRTSASAGGAK